MLLASLNINAQDVETTPHVDTLTMAQRLSLHTNLFDWSTLTPNVGLEFALKNTNWSRWTVRANVKWRPHTDHTFSPELVYNIFDARMEVRNYWRERDMSDPVNRLLPEHKSIIDKTFSMRSRAPKHPKTVYYRGFYAGYTSLSVLVKNHGRQGRGFQAGVLYGIQRPLYEFKNGTSIDFDFGISAGVAFAKYDKYGYDKGDAVYYRWEHKDYGILPYPIVSDIHAGIVYRIGYPLRKRYQWRYEVDLDYQARMDSINAMRSRARIENHYRDSMNNLVFDAFQHAYDSICIAQQQAADSLSFLSTTRLESKHQHKVELVRESKRAAKDAQRTLRDLQRRSRKAESRTVRAEKRAVSRAAKAEKARKKRIEKLRKAQAQNQRKAAKRRAALMQEMASEARLDSLMKAKEEAKKARYEEMDRKLDEEKAKADAATREANAKIREIMIQEKKRDQERRARGLKVKSAIKPQEYGPK